MGVAAQGTKATTAKKAAVTKTSKPAPSHPPYIQMITEALVALKERTGSSHYAIAKHIEEEQKAKDLPSNFKKLLSVQLKKFVLSGKLVKVKNSFKLPPKTTSTSSAAAKTAVEKPKAAEKKANKPTATAAAPAAKTKTTAAKTKSTAAAKGKGTKDVKSKSLKVVKSPMKKKAPPAVAKAKKPKSIKSPVKKAAAAAPAAKKAKK